MNKAYKFSEMKVALHSALERMKRMPKSTLPYVVVEFLRTGQFIQFRGSSEENILIDIPDVIVGILNNVLDYDVIATEMGKPQLVTGQVKLQTFKKEYVDIDSAVDVAVYMAQYAMGWGDPIHSLTTINIEEGIQSDGK